MSQAVFRNSRGLHRASQGQSRCRNLRAWAIMERVGLRTQAARGRDEHTGNSWAINERIRRTIISSWPEFDIT